jgi:uncharacterized protein (TIGR03435 family)
MLQTLLAERFGLKVHHESKDIDGYDLILAKGGPKLKIAEPPSAPWLPSPSLPEDNLRGTKMGA